MSDNVIDLFDKKSPIEQRIETIKQLNQQVADRIGGEEFGALFNGVILSTLEQDGLIAGGSRFTVQHRTTHEKDPKPYLLFSCLSQVPFVITGDKKHHPRLAFQLRIDRRDPNKGKYLARDIKFIEKNIVMDWLEQEGVKFSPHLYAYGYIQGIFSAEPQKTSVTSVKHRGNKVYESCYENENFLFRIRVFGNTLIEDHRVIKAYLESL